MAAEPIVIFSHKVDPAGVLAVLRRMSPGLVVTGPEDNWTRAAIVHRRMLRRTTVTFSHDRGYYAGGDWIRQMDGMRGYFSRFPENENTQQVMLLIASFRFAISLFPAPEPELHVESDDPRLAYVFAVAKHLDGALFTPSALRDASGRVLLGAVEADPSAIMPAVFKQVVGVPRSDRPRDQHGTRPSDDDPRPPTPRRVARRACALAAVASRALLEQEDPADPGVEETRGRILNWVKESNLGDELEPDERKLLQSPLGRPPRGDVVGATWRLEGLGVLAWALGQAELPPYDGLVEPGVLLRAVHILDANGAIGMIESASLRPAAELRRLRERMFAVHWRVTDFRLKRAAMNFEEFARIAWFGPLDLDGLRLVDGDLAVGAHPIAAARADAVSTVSSAALERHLAINWLVGDAEVYSRTDVST